MQNYNNWLERRVNLAGKVMNKYTDLAEVLVMVESAILILKGAMKAIYG